MEETVFEYLIQGIGVAVLLSVVLCGAIRFGVGYYSGPAMAGLAIGLAFLGAYINLLDWPPWPPVSASQKVGYLVLAGLAVGGLLDGLKSLKPIRINRFALVVLPGLIVGWIGWRQITSFSVEGQLTLAVLWLAGGFIFVRLQAAAQYHNTGVAVVLVLAASVGISVIAFTGAAASQAQLAGLLAASVGGFLLWNWPTPRYAFNQAAVFASATALMSIATTVVLYTDAAKVAMVFIPGIFLVPAVLADKPLAKLPLTDKPALQALVIGGATLIPVALAVGLALIS